MLLFAASCYHLLVFAGVCWYLLLVAAICYCLLQFAAGCCYLLLCAAACCCRLLFPVICWSLGCCLLLVYLIRFVLLLLLLPDLKHRPKMTLRALKMVPEASKSLPEWPKNDPWKHPGDHRKPKASLFWKESIFETILDPKMVHFRPPQVVTFGSQNPRFLVEITLCSSGVAPELI